MEMTPPPAAGLNTAAMGGDRIRLLAANTLVTELDGRYWTAAETCASFTGRVIGLYACEGTLLISVTAVGCAAWLGRTRIGGEV